MSSIIKVINIEDENPTTSVLRQKAQDVSFPLSASDLELITMMQEFVFNAGGVGLAAPQVNVNKNIAVIYIPKSAQLLRDNANIYPMHTIINASYKKTEDAEIIFDFEGCYSVKTIYGQTPRYSKITVTCQNERGQKNSFEATGFYARVIQHEIDHLNGLLFIDRFTSDCLQGSPEEMLEIRRKSLSKDKQKLFDNLLKQKNIVTTGIDNE